MAAYGACLWGLVRAAVCLGAVPAPVREGSEATLRAIFLLLVAPPLVAATACVNGWGLLLVICALVAMALAILSRPFAAEGMGLLALCYALLGTLILTGGSLDILPPLLAVFSYLVLRFGPILWQSSRY